VKNLRGAKVWRVVQFANLRIGVMVEALSDRDVT
jgi:hypothetical protein